MKRISPLTSVVLSLVLASCSFGISYGPEIGIPQQTATVAANASTLADSMTSATPIPGVATLPADTPILATFPASESLISRVATLPAGNSPAQQIYQNSSLGIRLSYPDTWYLQGLTSSKDIWGVVTQMPAISMTSFDPANPPHKLEWTAETVSLQIRFQPIGTRPVSLDNWVEVHRQAAIANQVDILAEERILISGQPAWYLFLSSGSGGMIHQVLTIFNLQEVEINVEGNFTLASAVLDTIQSITYGRLKPPDSDTPAAGICNETQGDPVAVVLGIGPDGLPKAGRCLILNPAQRIKLINQSDGLYTVVFAEYGINLPMGDEVLLDKPVGEYLALGVHFLPLGPELWVKEAVVATAPPPIVSYSNHVVGYKLGLPGDWLVDENGMTNSLYKEVAFYPPNAEPFIAYLSILLDFRTLDQIIQYYAQNVPNAVREDTIFNGYPGIKYNYIYQGSIVRVEYFIPRGNRIIQILTDKPNDSVVQSILMTIQFTESSSTTYEATIADNGKTFNMKVGDNLRLNLDGSYDWSAVSVSDTSVIVVAEGTYLAYAAGTATLTTTGNPKCLNSMPPCGMPSIMFAITVMVQ